MIIIIIKRIVIIIILTIIIIIIIIIIFIGTCVKAQKIKCRTKRKIKAAEESAT